MKKSRWYYIDTGCRDGAFNMAFDWMLCTASLEYPVLRVFGWEPYAISLGYLQKVDDIKIESLNGIDLVRRPTGGRAVFHSEELTYSVIIPRAHEMYKLSNAQVYEFVHIALNEALNRIGVRSSLESRQTPYKTLTANPVCFSSKAKSEVQYQGKKLIGSAQRRLREALLQHGSILTGDFHLNIVKYLRNTTQNSVEALRSVSSSVESITGEKVDHGHFAGIIKGSFEDTGNVEFCSPGNIENLLDEAERIRTDFDVLVSDNKIMRVQEL